MNRITILGTSNIDFVCHTDKLPSPGQTVAGTQFQVSPGGKGANQAVAAARLGSSAVFLSKLGSLDPYRELLTEGFRWAGLDFSRVETESGHYCGAALILIDGSAQNIIAIVDNANRAITPEYVDHHRRAIEASQAFMVELGVPLAAAEHATVLARQAGILTVVNPAPAMAMSGRFYEAIDIITPNETEAAQLTGVEIKDTSSCAQACRYFHDRGVRDVVITLGRQGAFLSDRGRGRHVAPFPVAAVDPTGAGDAFCAGLACALVEGQELPRAVRYACAAGALCASRPGAIRAMPARSEVVSMIDEGE